MDENEPTQRTPTDPETRKKLGTRDRSEGGLEIPIPTRDQVESDFAKIISPVPPKPEKKRRGRRTK
jgi:hypothetical protein